MKKIIAIIFTLGVFGLSDEVKPLKLIHNFKIVEGKKETSVNLIRKDIKIYIGDKLFSKLVEIDRDKDGVFEEFMQVFYDEGKQFLHVYKMKVAGFMVQPNKRMFYSVTDAPNSNGTFLYIKNRESRTVMFLQKTKLGSYKPAPLEIAKAYVKMVNGGKF